jgi:hypothetical protein
MTLLRTQRQIRAANEDQIATERLRLSRKLEAIASATLAQRKAASTLRSARRFLTELQTEERAIRRHLRTLLSTYARRYPLTPLPPAHPDAGVGPAQQPRRA